MQVSWRDSADKCTFIILDKDILEKDKTDPESRRDEREIRAMVGDTNLFLQSPEEDEKTSPIVAEAEIMIAEPGARGKRLGWEAMCLMLRWVGVYSTLLNIS